MASTKSKAQKPSPEETEAAAAYFKTWHPVTYSLSLWALLWVVTGALRILSIIFGMPTPLPRVELLPAMWISIAFGVGSTLAWNYASTSKRRRQEADLAREQRLLLAERGLPDPGNDALKKQAEDAAAKIEQRREAFETVCHTSGLQALKPGEDEKTIPRLLNGRCTVDQDVEFDLVTAGGNGITLDDIRTNLRRFAEVAGVKRVKLRRRGGTIGRATITFLDTDPLERFNYVRDLQLPKVPGNLVIGVDEDDNPAELPSDRPILIGGYQGSGKSSIGWSALASLAQQHRAVELYLIDPKEMELRAWKSKVGQGWLPNNIRVMAYAGEDREEGLKVIHAAYDRMKERADRFGEMGVQNAVTELENSQENPYVLIVNDEVGDYLDLEKNGKENWNRLKQKARATGVNVMSFAITVNDSEMGAGRKLYGTRVGLRAEAGTGVALFGADAVTRGAELNRISPEEPGVGYIVDPATGELKKFRAAFVSKDDRSRLVAGELPEGMGLGMPEEDEGGEWPVYWHRSADGQSLYVGKGDPETRWQEHKNKAWAELVDHSNRVVWHKDSQAEQLAWEQLMIEVKRPIYNIQHNLDNPMRRDWKPVYEPLNVEPVEVVEEFERRLKVKPRHLAALRRVIPTRKPKVAQEPAEDVLEPDGIVQADDSLLVDLKANRFTKPRTRSVA